MIHTTIVARTNVFIVRPGPAMSSDDELEANSCNLSLSVQVRGAAVALPALKREEATSSLRQCGFLFDFVAAATTTTDSTRTNATIAGLMCMTRVRGEVTRRWVPTARERQENRFTKERFEFGSLFRHLCPSCPPTAENVFNPVDL